MNGNFYYNPYNYYKYISRGFGIKNSSKLFSNFFKKFNFNNFLSGTSKTLNVINQAIPIYYQIKPMVNNAKTLFKIANAVKSDNVVNISNNNSNSNNNNNNNNIINKSNDNPIFFI